MIKQKASDPTLDSAPLLSHLPSGWIWLNVSYCLEEIDGNQTPSLALGDILAWLPHTDWFCVQMCAHVLHFYLILILQQSLGHNILSLDFEAKHIRWPSSVEIKKDNSLTPYTHTHTQLCAAWQFTRHSD